MNRSDEITNPDQKPGSKRKYERPTYEFERVFETTALACAKIPQNCKKASGSRFS